MRVTPYWLTALGLYLCTCGPAMAETPAAAATTTIAFVGDIMLDELPGEEIRQGRDPLAPFNEILNTADIRIGNLECVIATKGTPEPDKPYTFRAHPRTLKVLKRHFDAMALANNHSGDFGPGAFAEMLDLLRQQQMPYFGGGHDQAQAHTPLLLERNGLRIAFLSYNEFFPRSFEADFDKPGIAWSEDEQVRLDITRARSVYHADIVIPMMHWGWEDERMASRRQQQLAKLMIDAGADAVVGGHPHVIQNTGLYKGKPIIYSLGNFVFNGFTDKVNNTGWLLRMEIDRQGVRAWRTFTADIDKSGTPHPATNANANESCWERGQKEARGCTR